MTLINNNLDFKFYKRLVILTLPIIIQNLINSLLNMADTVMIGRLGEVELASVGIANQFFFFYSLILFGINAGGAMFISQYWGKNDVENIRKTMAISLFSTIIISLVFTFIGITVSENIIKVFNPDFHVVFYGSSYLKIVAFSYLFTGVTVSFAFASRSIENTILPMIANMVGLFVNIVLNYALIFGNLGLPELGVRGAAIATVIARIIEALLIIFYIYYNKLIIDIKVRDIGLIDKRFVKIILIGTLPILINEFVWGLGNITYNIIYARIGVSATATMQISTTIMNLFMIVIMGLGNSSVVVIGKEIGANNIENAKLFGKRLYKTSLVVGVFIAIVVFTNAENLVALFNMPENVLLDTKVTLQVNSIILLLRTYNFMMIVGILRAGGDSKYAVITQGVTMWLIGIPLAYVGAFIFKIPIYGVIGLSTLEELIKMIILSRRFNSGRWVQNITG